MNEVGSVIVSWDFSHGLDKDILLVGKQENGVVTVINAYRGQEARDIHKKLTVKRRKA